MRRITIVFIVACLYLGQTTLAFPASAPILSWEQIGHQALQQVNWDWRLILNEWIIEFGPGRPGYHGITNVITRRIMIWIRPSESPESVAGTIVHEVAHAFDVKYLTPSLRNDWLVVRHLPPNTPWYSPVGNLSSDYLSGAGDFAESVSWTLQGQVAGFRSCLGLSLNNAQKQRIAAGCHGLSPNKAQQTLIRQWLAELPQTGGK